MTNAPEYVAGAVSCLTPWTRSEFRLLRAVQTDELVEGFTRHRTEPHAERVSAASLHFLADNGRTATNLLSTLAASEMPSDPTVAVSFAALTNDLLDALGL